MHMRIAASVAADAAHTFDDGLYRCDGLCLEDGNILRDLTT